MPVLAKVYVLPVCIVSQTMTFLQFCLPFFFLFCGLGMTCRSSLTASSGEGSCSLSCCTFSCMQTELLTPALSNYVPKRSKIPAFTTLQHPQTMDLACMPRTPGPPAVNWTHKYSTPLYILYAFFISIWLIEFPFVLFVCLFLNFIYLFLFCTCSHSLLFLSPFWFCVCVLLNRSVCL